MGWELLQIVTVVGVTRSPPARMPLFGQHIRVPDGGSIPPPLSNTYSRHQSSSCYSIILLTVLPSIITPSISSCITPTIHDPVIHHSVFTISLSIISFPSCYLPLRPSIVTYPPTNQTSSPGSAFDKPGLDQARFPLR